MAAPSYTTDLTDIATGDEASGWVELTGTVNAEAYNVQGAPAYEDPDYPYIQGAFSVTQDCTKDAGIGSLAYPLAASITIPTDGAVLVWHNYMVASNIDLYANGGLQICIGTTTSDFHVFFTGGVDKAPYPYGGWVNHAANPTVTNDGTVGTVTTYDYVGSAVYVTTGSSKGEVHNVDAIRYGRCSAEFTNGDLTNGYCTFAGYAAVNDTNTNRWGLLQNTAGGFLWKGHMSLGTAATAADFRDSNKTIFVDWTPKVTTNFNTIEVLNTGTNVDWSGITISCLDTTTASKGRFLMTAQANLSFVGCSFIDMDTFTFSKNVNTVTVSGTSFIRCGTVTTGGATLTDCTLTNSTASASVIASDLNQISNCTFTSDGSNHAVELTSIGGGSMVWNATTSNYDTGATGSPVTPTSTGNEDIYVNVATASDLTINVGTGATTPSIRVGASFTGSVNVVAGQKTKTFNISPVPTDYEYRIYTVTAVGSLVGAVEVQGTEHSSAASQAYTYSYVANTHIAFQLLDHSKVYKEKIEYYTLEDANTTVTINLEEDTND